MLLYYRETINLRGKGETVQILLCDKALLYTKYPYSGVAIPTIEVGTRLSLTTIKKSSEGYKYGAFIQIKDEENTKASYFFHGKIDIKKGSMPTMDEIKCLLVEHLI